MALEYINFMRLRELTERANLNERAEYLKETYGANIPSYYEFCRSHGGEKRNTTQKITRTAAYGLFGAALGGLSLFLPVVGPIGASFIAAGGAALFGAVAMSTNDTMPMLSQRPMLNAYKAQLDVIEAQLSQGNDMVMGAMKAVGGAAVDMAKGTVKGAAAVAAGAVSATADLAADGAEMVADAAAETVQKAASKTHDNFRDMVQTSRTELEQQAER